PGVREYGDRTGDGLCRMGLSRRRHEPHLAGAHREQEGAACVAFSEFGRDPGPDSATTNKKRASRRSREALWAAAASMPKGSTKAALLEGKNNLLRMRQEIPLSDSELAALDDGLSALESLLSRLADVPTPAGPTPLQLRETALIQIEAAD
ncbi:MAG: hypothetical protein WBV50_22790, partial [Candidatus Acidiferrum sp.]